MKTKKQKIIYRLIDMAENMKSVAEDLKEIRKDKGEELKGASSIASDWAKDIKEELEKEI